MRRADVLRALSQNSGRVVEVAVDGVDPLGAVTSGLGAATPGVVVMAVLPGGSMIRLDEIVGTVHDAGHQIVGVVPLDDGDAAVLCRTSTPGEVVSVLTDAGGTELRAVTRERDELKRRLERILRSRSYRLARRMARAKRRVAGLVHRH